MRHLNQQRAARKHPRSSLHAQFRLTGPATTWSHSRHSAQNRENGPQTAQVGL